MTQPRERLFSTRVGLLGVSLVGGLFWACMHHPPEKALSTCGDDAARAARSPALPSRDAGPAILCASAPTGIANVAFHGDRARLGWNAKETDLSPLNVASPSFGALWDSLPFDSVELAGKSYQARMYASPLYLDEVAVAGGDYDGLSLGLVFAATSNAQVYAVNAFTQVCGGREVRAGSVVWRASVGTPVIVPRHDGGVPLGVLSTPFIDAAAVPPRMYVASIDACNGWQVSALDIRSGAQLPGWPVVLGAEAVVAANTNGPASFADKSTISQRGALNVSPDGAFLYVPFGAYFDGGVGWMIAIDTRAAKIAQSFSSAPSSMPVANGGIWSAGGTAIDDAGRLFATTGNSPEGAGAAPHLWGQTLLRWDGPLTLSGTYTPFNYCALDRIDADLGGSSPLVVPDLGASATSTPHTVTFGGKQGTVYLLDRDRLTGSLEKRPPCGGSAAEDGSLLPPDPQPEFGVRGPLNVFGPYSENFGNLDYGKMRTTPAYFRDVAGTSHIFVAGASKAAENSPKSVPPSIVRLTITTSPGKPAYLSIAKRDPTLAFFNPGSPVVSSHGGTDPIVWVLDENAPRTASLLDPNTARPVLYAADGLSLTTLWKSGRDVLHAGGKYASPLIAHGVVFVGTDRIQAFGLRP